MSGGNWKELFEAACAGDLDLVRYHIDGGVDVNYAHPEYLATPLVACILAGQAPAAQLLLDHGANPHLRSEFDGATPLQAARRSLQHPGMADVAQRLAAMGAVASDEPNSAPAPAAASGWRGAWWNPFRRRGAG